MVDDLISRGSLLKIFGAYVENPSVLRARHFGGFRVLFAFDLVSIPDGFSVVKREFRDGTVLF